MGNKLRLILVIFFLSCAGGLFYLHYHKSSQPKPKKTYWSFELKENKDIIPFLCKANQLYTFRSPHAYHKITINGNTHSLRDFKYQYFLISFPKDTNILLDCYIDGVFFKTGRLEIWEGKHLNAYRLLHLTPHNYNNYSFKVAKGMRFDIPKQKEVFFIGYFRDGLLKRETLVRPCSGSHCFHYFRNWDNHDIKFRAAEVPFLMQAPNCKYEDLRVQIKTVFRSDRTINKTIGKAWYLKKGEVKKTPFWLDKGDEIKFIEFTGRYKNRQAPLQLLTNSGFIRIKAKKDCVVERVEIKHKKSGALRLKPGQTKKVKIYPNDIIKSKSSSRYYVDGRILEADTTHKHTRRSEGYLEFKGSLNPKPIKVWVYSRRGY